MRWMVGAERGKKESRGKVFKAVMTVNCEVKSSQVRSGQVK